MPGAMLGAVRGLSEGCKQEREGLVGVLKDCCSEKKDLEEGTWGRKTSEVVCPCGSCWQPELGESGRSRGGRVRRCLIDQP